MDSFSLTEETTIPNKEVEVVKKSKICSTCKENKNILLFRTYGKGRRTNCIDCEKLAASSSEVENEETLSDELVVKSSLGFSVCIVDEDTYTISQQQNTIKLQPHEAVALINWLKERLYPEEIVIEEE